jgi:hypothetical protein
VRAVRTDRASRALAGPLPLTEWGTGPKDTIVKPLDVARSPSRGTRSPVRGPAAALPPIQPHGCSLDLVRCGTREEGEGQEKKGERGENTMVLCRRRSSSPSPATRRRGPSHPATAATIVWRCWIRKRKV